MCCGYCWWKAKRKGGGILCFVFPRLLEVRMEPRQLQRHAGRIIMMFSYGETKDFFLMIVCLEFWRGRGGGEVGIVVAGTGFAELWMMDDFSRVRSGKWRVTTVLSEFTPSAGLKNSAGQTRRETHLYKELQLPVIQEMDLTSPPLCHLQIKKRKIMNDFSRLCFLYYSVQHLKSVKQQTRT